MISTARITKPPKKSPAPAVQNRAAKTPESHPNRVARKDPATARTSRDASVAPAVMQANPQEKTEVPANVNREDAIKDTPKPAAANDQPVAKDDSN